MILYICIVFVQNGRAIAETEVFQMGKKNVGIAPSLDAGQKVVLSPAPQELGTILPGFQGGLD